MTLQVTQYPGFFGSGTGATSPAGDVDGVIATSNESSAVSGAQIDDGEAVNPAGAKEWFGNALQGGGAPTITGKVPNRLFSTLLNGAYALGSTAAINVDNTENFTASGYIIVDSEIIAYTAKTPTTFTGITRGQFGTADANHSDNATVYQGDAVTEGTYCITFGLKTHLATSYAYLDLGSNQDYSANPYITFSWRWNVGNTHTDEGIVFEAAADGSIGSPHTSIRLPLTKESTWTTMPRLKLETPSTVRYLIWRSTGEGNSATGHTTCYVDDIRKAAASELDTAMSAASATAFVHAAESMTNEALTMPDASDAMIDMRSHVRIISDFNGKKYVRQFLIDGTGTTAVENEMQLLFNSLDEGDILEFPANGRYKYNGFRDLSLWYKRNVTILGNNSIIFTTQFPTVFGSIIGSVSPYRRGRKFFVPVCCDNIKVYDLHVFGYQKWYAPGSRWNDGTTNLTTPRVSAVTLTGNTHDGGANASIFYDASGNFVVDGVRAGQWLTTSKGDSGTIASATATTITMDTFGLGTSTDDDFDVGTTITVQSGGYLDTQNQMQYLVGTSSGGNYTRKARILKVQDPTYVTEDFMYRWDVEWSATAISTGDLRLRVIDELDNVWYTNTLDTVATTIQTTRIAISTAGKNIRLKVRLEAQKMTTDVNTITIRTAIDYGRVSYNGLTEFERAFVTGGSVGTVTANSGLVNRNIQFFRCHAEGVGGDGFETDGEVDTVQYHGCTSRGNGRQGASLSGGRHILWEGGWIDSPARACIDHEPAGSEHLKHVIVRDTVLSNPGDPFNCVSAATNPASKALVAVTADATQLNGAIGTGTGNVEVDSTTGFTAPGYILLTDSEGTEIASFSAVLAGPPRLTLDARGQLGTTARSFADNATVEEVNTTARTSGSTADIRLAGGSGDPTDNFQSSGTVLIDEELFTYTAKTSTALTGTIAAGAQGTFNTAHASGSTVTTMDFPTEDVVYDNVEFWVSSVDSNGIKAHGKNWRIQNCRFKDSPDITINGGLSAAINLDANSRGAVIRNVVSNAKLTIDGHGPVLDGVAINIRKTSDFTATGNKADPLIAGSAIDPQFSDITINGQPYA